MYPFSVHEINSLTAALAGMKEFVFLETSRVTDEEHRSLLFYRPLKWLACSVSDDPDHFLDQLDRKRDQGLFCAGWFAYEFGYLLEPSLRRLLAGIDREKPLALFGVFEKPLVVDHREGSYPEETSWLFRKKAQEESCTVGELQPNCSRSEYLAAIERIKALITAGDTYQVNFTLKLRGEVSGSAAALYRRLRRNQAVSYSAWVRHAGHDIMSFSPELFFRADGQRLRVRPMKGTAQRGRHGTEDVALGRQLQQDGKNRSENVMIVDLLRNDLSRLLHETGGGQVVPRSLFDIETYETLLQMTSTVDALPAHDRLPGLRQIIPALFPCGSVTGAPKVRTMEIIEKLEKEHRGVYCGAIGFAGPDEAVFNVPIRTLEFGEGQCVMGIGSGIVHDSDPEGEWKECLLKGRFLTIVQPDFQLIETLFWQPGAGYLLLDKHLDRLMSSARYFLFPGDEKTIRHALRAAAASFDTNSRIRLLVDRDGQASVEATDMDKDDAPEYTVPKSMEVLPEVIFSERQTDPADRFLYHKTTQRELYNRERSRAVSQGYYEVIFTNIRNEVTEGSITNLFLAINGELVTPPLKSGLLAGTLRQLLLEQGRVQERVVSLVDLHEADALYVGNSVRGLVQVRLA